MKFIIRFGGVDDARVKLLFPVADFVPIAGECVRSVGIVGKLVDFGGSVDLHGSTDAGDVITGLPALPDALAWSDILLRRALV